MPTSTPDVAEFGVLVIGAGPAGLAAAVGAATAVQRYHLRVAMLDAGPRLGGQFWRHREGDTGRGHHDWAAFDRLRSEVARLEAAGVLTVLRERPVWHLERAGDGVFRAHVAGAGATVEVRGRAVVIATGAHDRPLPFPGWTLPGVITAGAAQALLKGQGVLPGRRIVVGGTGPFLLPVAAALAEAGADVAAVLEAGRPTAAIRRPLVLARNATKLGEAARYLAVLARHRIPYQSRRAVVAAHGEEVVTAVTSAALDADWRIVAGSEARIECDTVAIGYGFTPQVELAADLGCELGLAADGNLVVMVDGRQRSSVDGAYVAGEACGVGGQALALVEGRLAGVHAAEDVTGASAPADGVSRLVRKRDRLRAFADVLPLAWPIRPGWRTWLTPETPACRCEEVTVRDLGAAVTELGATDARTAKLFSRAGMGACQGRVCGFHVSSLTAATLGREPTIEDLGAFARRPVAWPVTLGALAAADVPSRSSATVGPADGVEEPAQ